jgi:AraC-like DNA-binding protein
VFFNAPLDGPDFTCATLDFDGGARNPIVQSLPPVMVVPLAAIGELDDTLHLLFAEADRQRCGSRLLTNRLFEVALIQILRWVVDHPDAAGVSHGLMRGLSDARLARTLVAMHQAPQDEWTLPRMAATAGMSRSAFAAVFKEVMQATPAAYLLDWRLSLACAQLRAGVAVKQVAIEWGLPIPPRCRRRSASGWGHRRGRGWPRAPRRLGKWMRVESTAGRLSRDARGFRCLTEGQPTSGRLYHRRCLRAGWPLNWTFRRASPAARRCARPPGRARLHPAGLRTSPRRSTGHRRPAAPRNCRARRIDIPASGGGRRPAPYRRPHGRSSASGSADSSMNISSARVALCADTRTKVW